MLDQMQTRAELYELIDYRAYEALDAWIAQTKVPARHAAARRPD